MLLRPCRAAFRDSSVFNISLKYFPAHLTARNYHQIVSNRSYDDAIQCLNTLQTPYKVLKARWDAGIKPNEIDKDEMKRYLSELGYSQDHLEKLNIVHVAGTKGKGSTCAYVDSILHQYGTSHDQPKKVGLFTSPHLIAVRERIRLNSRPISSDLFAKYFFEVWDSLSSLTQKPAYFRYLTLMSYHVFIQEKVDVAIYEVGVGGEFDSTNLVERPAVTGISKLGIDHVFVLGDTIDKIAWNKAGIQKGGVPSFTVEQVPEALKVIRDRAQKRQVKSLEIVKIDSRLEGVKIVPDALFQKGNASLAIALAESVLKKLDSSFKPSETLSKEFVDGLGKMILRGRCETKVDGNITWYLDGAHTADSIAIASKWFGDACSKEPGLRVLIFNQQGHRDSTELLDGLYAAIALQGQVKFDYVIFCATVPSEKTSRKDFVNMSMDTIALAGLTMQKAFAEQWKTLDPLSHTKVSVLPTVEDALQYVKDLSVQGDNRDDCRRVHAFITGSVHLIGRALGSLEGVDAL